MNAIPSSLPQTSHHNFFTYSLILPTDPSLINGMITSLSVQLERDSASLTSACPFSHLTSSAEGHRHGRRLSHGRRDGALQSPIEIAKSAVAIAVRGPVFFPQEPHAQKGVASAIRSPTARASHHPHSVAGLNTDRWPTSIGIDGRDALELLTALRRIMQPYSLASRNDGWLPLSSMRSRCSSRGM